MKLTPEQKEVRKALKADVESMGGELFTYEAEKMVVLVCPAVRGEAEYAHVAVARCCEEDKFTRKQGELLALTRWVWGDVLRVPYGNRTNLDISQGLMDLFAY